MQAFFSASETFIQLIGTGGTIAGHSADPSDELGYTAGVLPVAALLAGLPLADGALAGVAVRDESLVQIDSKNMCWDIWWLLARRVRACLAKTLCRGVIITHGTDTLEETAWFLACVLGDVAQDKPVILTCAMRPASAAQPDGPHNLANALIAASTPGARGVLVCVAGELWGAQHVQKNHPTQLAAFNAAGLPPVATVDGHQVVMQQAWPTLPSWVRAKSEALASVLAHDDAPPNQPWVEVVMHTAAASTQLLPALGAAGIRGLIVQATGNGTVNDTWQTQLGVLTNEGVVVRCASRCASGALLGLATSEDKKGQTLSGLTFYPGLNAAKSRVMLMLALLVPPASHPD